MNKERVSDIHKTVHEILHIVVDKPLDVAGPAVVHVLCLLMLANNKSLLEAETFLVEDIIPTLYSGLLSIDSRRETTIVPQVNELN